MIERVFQSGDVPAAERFEYWREQLTRTVVPVEIYSNHQGNFRAYQRILELGAVYVRTSAFLPLQAIRTSRLIRESDPERYHLSISSRGVMRTSWNGRETVTGVGDLYAYDTSRPGTFTLAVSEAESLAEMTSLAVPKAMVPLPHRSMDRLLGGRLPGQEGIGALLSGFLTRLSADTGSIRPADGPRLGAVLLDLFPALFAHLLEADATLEPETRQRALALRIQSFIQQHLHDPDLTPSAIAAAHHISLSYLHRLFQSHATTTVAAWIRQLRLERARRDLADPALRAVAIHGIASRWGFPRPEDFSRAFRAAYSITPKDYRHQALLDSV
ncbi:helix-turn-helix domain-containing protein [Nonomuraea sp. NPDC000554]|uniref:helix-turn-helix domain-containing protein n=1 Tax=Nonomuraea sp. NPDC000554 TaxID=3154259 RepID=UPI00332C765D